MKIKHMKNSIILGTVFPRNSAPGLIRFRQWILGVFSRTYSTQNKSINYGVLKECQEHEVSTEMK